MIFSMAATCFPSLDLEEKEKESGECAVPGSRDGLKIPAPLFIVPTFFIL